MREVKTEREASTLMLKGDEDAMKKGVKGQGEGLKGPNYDVMHVLHWRDEGSGCTTRLLTSR